MMRRAGTVMNISTKAEAIPSVMGKPRRTLLIAGSRGVPGGALEATTRPTMTGTASASASQTTLTIQLGTRFDRGMKPITRAAILGKAIPASRIGQAAAAATSPDSSVCCFGEVRPNSATTAHPKIAFRILPADLPRNEMSACSSAM
jgi:hypothetical protein